MLRYLDHPWEFLGTLVAVALGLYGHNFAQAASARMLGDRGPQRQGFLTFEPRRQLDPFGAVAVMLAYYGGGFAAPVPVETRFRRGRVRASVALLAGPLWLLVLTFAGAALVRYGPGHNSLGISDFEDFSLYATRAAAGLLIVSLFPFPPLALGRVLSMYAPTSPGWQRARYQLEENQLGRVLALVILLLPLVLNFPDLVGELAQPLFKHVINAV